MRHAIGATVASGVVVAITLGFYGFARSLVPPSPRSAYELHAIFLSSSGLAAGADVKIGGVTIGAVRSVTLDPASFVSDVAFGIQAGYRLPVDSSLEVGSSGFTSPASLMVSPGRSSKLLSPGAVIRDTHPMVSLEESVSQYIFGTGSFDSGSKP